jgi:hypothetical protein
MNVAHFASPLAKGRGVNRLSSKSETDDARSERSDGESVKSSNSIAEKVMLHDYMVNISSNQEEGGNSDKSPRKTMHMTVTMWKAISTDQTK